jgi:hypothetical protein
MTSKSIIIEQVGPEVYERACHHAQQDAMDPNYGGQQLPRRFDSKIAHKISDLVWESQLSSLEKLELVLQFYDDMPCYAYLMNLNSQFHNLSKEEKNLFWQWVRAQLDSEDTAIKSPLGYSLWCNFFEDPQTVAEAWAKLLKPLPSDIALQMLLNVSGPVPFDLKKQIYDMLVDKPVWHPYIFQSLLHSQFDVYGKIDKQAARQILQKLNLPENTEHLGRLNEELQS